MSENDEQEPRARHERFMETASTMGRVVTRTPEEEAEFRKRLAANREALRRLQAQIDAEQQED